MAAGSGMAVASPMMMSGTSSNSSGIDIINVSSSQLQLLGLARISRSQSLQRCCSWSGSRSGGVLPRASAESSEAAASRKDAVRSSKSPALSSESTPGIHLDRRHLLLGSTAAAAAGLVLPSAGAAPIGAPDLTKCIPATDDRLKALGIASVQCCPPLPGVPIKDFRFPPPLPLKVRKPVHLLTDQEKATYERAYAAIAALPESDPRSFTAQANVHCAYCNYGYFQQDGVTPLQVHQNWLFFPFHRWYIYFHERILAKFANDPTFALPYWNWDNQATTDPLPNTIPAVYLDPARYPTLNRGIRDLTHLPPALLDFTRGGVPQSTPDALREANTAAIYANVVSAVTTPSLFFGGRYVAGDAQTPGGGLPESLPHGPPHGWTGGKGGAGEDMGNFYSTGRDPTFYAHHCNVDRFWTVWKTLRATNRDFDDPDYLNATFLFYDENAELTRVRVGDCLDTLKLGYNFAPAPDLWRFYTPTTTTAASSATTTTSVGFLDGLLGGSGAAEDDDSSTRRGGRRRPRRRLEDLTEFGGEKRTIDTEEGLAFKLPRPDRPQRRGRRGGPPPGTRNRSLTPAPAGDDDEDEEEILVIKGVKVPIAERISFDVFLNLPDADKSTPLTVANYVGSYYNVPHTGPGGQTQLTTTVRLGLGDTLKQLGITDTSELVVTLVPCEGDTPVVVTDVGIEYE